MQLKKFFQIFIGFVISFALFFMIDYIFALSGIAGSDRHEVAGEMQSIDCVRNAYFLPDVCTVKMADGLQFDVFVMAIPVNQPAEEITHRRISVIIEERGLMRRWVSVTQQIP